MPPKPNTKPGAENPTKPPLPTDEYDTMDVPQLQEALRRNTNKLTELRRNRNYFQLEKDQIQQFYDIVREEVEKTRSHIRNVEAQLERMQDTHANDLKVYMQRVLHLEYEHTANVESIQAAGEKERLEQIQAHNTKATRFARQRLELENALEREEIQRHEEITALREIEKKELAKLSEKFARQHQQLQEQYEERLREMREELDVRRRLLLHEVSERHNSHINTLIWNHESKIEESRAYYQAITRDNVALIDVLQKRVAELKKKHVESEQILNNLNVENATVVVPVRESTAEVEVLESKLHSMEHYKQGLEILVSRKNSLIKKIHKLNDDYQALVQQHSTLQRQRDQLCNAFESLVLNSQKEADARTEELEAVLSKLQHMYIDKNAQFGAVLRASHLEPAVLQAISRKLNDVLLSKSEHIEELRYEVAKATKAHDDMIRVYEARLVELGIPAEEVKIENLLGSGNTAGVGLVTK